MKATKTKFRSLVEIYRTKSVPKGEAPKTFLDVAHELKISRQHLYNLMNGKAAASDWLATAIAKKFGVAKKTVLA